MGLWCYATWWSSASSPAPLVLGLGLNPPVEFWFQSGQELLAYLNNRRIQVKQVSHLDVCPTGYGHIRYGPTADYYYGRTLLRYYKLARVRRLTLAGLIEAVTMSSLPDPRLAIDLTSNSAVAISPDVFPPAHLIRQVGLPDSGHAAGPHYEFKYHLWDQKVLDRPASVTVYLSFMAYGWSRVQLFGCVEWPGGLYLHVLRMVLTTRVGTLGYRVMRCSEAFQDVVEKLRCGRQNDFGLTTFTMEALEREYARYAGRQPLRRMLKGLLRYSSRQTTSPYTSAI